MRASFARTGGGAKGAWWTEFLADQAGTRERFPILAKNSAEAPSQVTALPSAALSVDGVR